MADINYFVCTLGQAVAVNEKSPHGFETITDFLDRQAQIVPNAPAVGFPLPSGNKDKEWDSVVTRLVHDEAYANLAKEAVGDVNHRSMLVPIPKDLLQGPDHERSSIKDGDVHERRSFPEHQQRTSSDVAFLFHTSGTSSGLPKPIPQSHYGAVGVLPCLPEGHNKATFTTTPLYHGGIADCFRAWTSGALIWLFPGKDEPITASNILKSLGCARQAEVTSKAAPVRYFSSVPYVLQMVSAEPAGMKLLQSMEIVGVGGAALPQDVGDSLVQNDVNLVSRFGSAECGFLLSSNREYGTDKEWQYLRSHDPNLLTFEEQDHGSGLSELIIRPQWPYMAKRNREDGSLATADLFASHPNIKNAWKYHSRADSQLTLITGKKFDPAPLEAAVASHELLSDAMIFGNGMQSAGALLFRSDRSQEMDKDHLLDEVWPAINRLNKEGQAHTRLSRPMLKVMEVGTPGLEKSSKGTILRAQAEKAYAKEIQSAYDQSIADAEDGTRIAVPDDEMPTAVLEIIKTVLGTGDRIPEDADLFSFGVDSVACMAIRAKLQSRILDPKANALPLNVVYDCGNIEKLSKYLINVRKGHATESEDEIQFMKDLVAKYSVPTTVPSSIKQPNGTDRAPETDHGGKEPRGEHILLTGATGALGAHILHLLRSDPSILQITCLVRASSPLAAHERVSKSLTARAKPGLPPFSPSTTTHASSAAPNASTAKPTVICIACTLSAPSLGIPPETYTHLANTTNIIIHAAWAVNFTARLRSFEKDHIAGLSHLLQLSNTAPKHAEPIRFLFLSSTASVTSTPSNKYPIAEQVSHDPEEASPLGYSRSKWVAENVINDFYRRISFPSSPPSVQTHDNDLQAPNVAILRIGQLTSDTHSGIWNTSEAYPLLLSTAPALHCLPNLKNLPLDWLPVDIAARAVLEIAESMKSQPQTERQTRACSPNPDTNTKARYGYGCPVFHILNPSTKPTWSDLLTLIRQLSPLQNIEILPPRQWLSKLEKYEGDIPAKKLVGLWKGAFGMNAENSENAMNEKDGKEKGPVGGDEKDEKKEEGKGGENNGKDKEDGEGEERIEWEMEKAKNMSVMMRDVGPLDGEFLGRMWRWVEGLGVKGDGKEGEKDGKGNGGG
ncbi:MAG: hypothetical protein Q9221_007645 [Calogaya cf. arnoldii]